MRSLCFGGKNDHLKPSFCPFSSFFPVCMLEYPSKEHFYWNTLAAGERLLDSTACAALLSFLFWLCYESEAPAARLSLLFFLSLGHAFPPSFSFSIPSHFSKFHHHVSLLIHKFLTSKRTRKFSNPISSFSPSFCISSLLYLLP